MKTLIFVLIVLFLTGCAHWQAMTQEQKNIAIATTIAGLVVGALVNDGDSHDHHCKGHHCGDSDSD